MFGQLHLLWLCNRCQALCFWWATVQSGSIWYRYGMPSLPEILRLEPQALNSYVRLGLEYFHWPTFVELSCQLMWQAPKPARSLWHAHLLLCKSRRQGGAGEPELFGDVWHSSRLTLLNFGARLPQTQTATTMRPSCKSLVPSWSKGNKQHHTHTHTTQKHKGKTNTTPEKETRKNNEETTDTHSQPMQPSGRSLVRICSKRI